MTPQKKQASMQGGKILFMFRGREINKENSPSYQKRVGLQYGP